MALQEVNLQLELVQHNAAVIHKNPDAIFKFDENGKLDTISRWNLIGRAVEWIKNTSSRGERAKALNYFFKHTLLNIEANLDSYSEMSPYQKIGNKNLVLFNSLPSRGFFFCFKRVYPVTFHALSDQILSSSLNQNKKLKKIAEKIKNKSEAIFKSETDLRDSLKHRSSLKQMLFPH